MACYTGYETVLRQIGKTKAAEQLRHFYYTRLKNFKVEAEPGLERKILELEFMYCLVEEFLQTNSSSQRQEQVLTLKKLSDSLISSHDFEHGVAAAFAANIFKDLLNHDLAAIQARIQQETVELKVFDLYYCCMHDLIVLVRKKSRPLDCRWAV